jgi:hypothetical protein
VDEGRERAIGVMASILVSLHMQTADDLFGCPQGSPRTDKLIDASIQWAERIMAKIDERERVNERNLISSTRQTPQLDRSKAKSLILRPDNSFKTTT